MTQNRTARAAETIEKSSHELAGSVLETVADHGHHVLERGHEALLERSQDVLNRSARARKQTRKAAKKAAKKATKRSAAVWSEFADEAAQRASNVVAAGRGGRVRQHRRTPWILGGLAVAVGALVAVSHRISLGTATPPLSEAITPLDIAADPALRA